MKCLSILSMNFFLSLTGVNITPEGEGVYKVHSTIPAYYVFDGENFCLKGDN